MRTPRPERRSNLIVLSAGCVGKALYDSRILACCRTSMSSRLGQSSAGGLVGRNAAPVCHFCDPAWFDAEVWEEPVLLNQAGSRGKGARNALLHHTSIQNRCEDHRLVCRQEYSVVH